MWVKMSRTFKRKMKQNGIFQHVIGWLESSGLDAFGLVEKVWSEYQQGDSIYFV